MAQCEEYDTVIIRILHYNKASKVHCRLLSQQNVFYRGAPAACTKARDLLQQPGV